MARKITKKRKKQNKRRYTTIAVLILLIIVGLYILISEYYAKFYSDRDVVADVDGYKIAQKELNERYELIPEQYRLFITKEILLNQLIDAHLFCQMRRKKKFQS